jgi:type I restriction enzyme S subunit
MRQKNDRFGTWLIKHMLQGQIFQSTMDAYANGSAQVNFGPTHLKQIKLPTPNLEISLAYEKIMAPLEECIKGIRDQNQYLKEARNILLPRLMTGMIDVEKMELKI